MNKCIDCGKEITPGCTRCNKCANKATWANPEYRRRHAEVMKASRSNPQYRQRRYRKKKKYKTCETCGKPLSKWQYKYCSDECRPEREPRFCETCGKPLPKWKIKYCSDECRPKVRSRLELKKKKVRERDNHMCVICGCPNSSGWTLDTHHINLDSTDHRKENMVTLCRSCHKLVHKDKVKYWQEFLTGVLGGNLTKYWTMEVLF